MQTIIKLNLTDIKKIISEYFNVDIKNISVTGCGNDTGDGPYAGSGYYCRIEVEKDNQENQFYYMRSSEKRY